MQKSSASQFSSFKLAMGQQLLAPHKILSGYHGLNLEAIDFIKQFIEKMDLVCYHLTRATDGMKKYANEGCQLFDFNVADRSTLLRMDPK